MMRIALRVLVFIGQSIVFTVVMMAALFATMAFAAWLGVDGL